MMPIDILLGSPTDDELPRSTADDYVAGYQDRLRQGYEIVRKHLGQAALRRKQQYDTSVKSSEILVGSWVWYFYPRRRVGLSPKWQRWYTGPYLVIRQIDSHCFVIQRSKRSRPMVVHRDKLKPCLGETPHNWVETNDESSEDRDEIHAQRKRNQTTRQPTQMNGGTTTTNIGEDQESEESPRINERRRPRRPRKYNDYICHYSLIAGVAMPRNRLISLRSKT